MFQGFSHWRNLCKAGTPRMWVFTWCPLCFNFRSKKKLEKHIYVEFKHANTHRFSKHVVFLCSTPFILNTQWNRKIVSKELSSSITWVGMGQKLSPSTVWDFSTCWVIIEYRAKCRLSLGLHMFSHSSSSANFCRNRIVSFLFSLNHVKLDSNSRGNILRILKFQVSFPWHTFW